MDTKLETLHKILKLNEFVKLSIEKDKKQNHHPLKNDLSKSSRRMLWVLRENGSLNQRTISKMLNVSPQAISESVKKLEANNLIIKDTSNKNETIIELTKEGLKQSNALKDSIQKHANILLSEFSDEELIPIIEFINKLINQEENNV